jgi:hypothetical protein
MSQSTKPGWEILEMAPQGSSLVGLSKAPPPGARHLIIGDIGKPDGEDCEIWEVFGRVLRLRRTTRFHHWPGEQVTFYAESQPKNR